MLFTATSITIEMARHPADLRWRISECEQLRRRKCQTASVLQAGSPAVTHSTLEAGLAG